MKEGKESRDSRERILGAAFEVFSEKGIEGARMHEIAKRAGVNQAMLHYYFSTKQGLYEEILYSIFSNVIGNIAPIFSEGDTPDPRVKIERFVEAYVDIIAANPKLPSIMLREMAGGAATVFKVMARVFSEKNIRVPENFMDIFEEGIRQGKLRPVKAEQAAISIIGMSLFYFVGRPLLKLVWGINESSEADIISERKKHIKDLLRHGLFIGADDMEELEDKGEE